MEDALFTLGFKAEVMVVTTRDGVHVDTKFKNNILYYASITQEIGDSHCEIMWSNKSGAGLGFHPTAEHEAAPDVPVNQAIISQQRFRSNNLGLWIQNFLTTDDKRKLRCFRSAYTFNNQYDGDVIFLSL